MAASEQPFKVSKHVNNKQEISVVRRSCSDRFSPFFQLATICRTWETALLYSLKANFAIRGNGSFWASRWIGDIQRSKGYDRMSKRGFSLAGLQNNGLPQRLLEETRQLVSGLRAKKLKIAAFLLGSKLRVERHGGYGTDLRESRRDESITFGSYTSSNHGP